MNLVSIHYMLLVQYVVMGEVKRGGTFQYIICCWFKLLLFYILYYVSFVSIHYMLLVQEHGLIQPITIKEFQYIICCWFNFIKNLFPTIQSCFNTLYVVGSKISQNLIKSTFSFNTLYVVGSTYGWIKELDCRVSIHYMLLVQYPTFIIQKK